MGRLMRDGETQIVTEEMKPNESVDKQEERTHLMNTGDEHSHKMAELVEMEQITREMEQQTRKIEHRTIEMERQTRALVQQTKILEQKGIEMEQKAGKLEQ